MSDELVITVFLVLYLCVIWLASRQQHSKPKRTLLHSNPQQALHKVTSVENTTFPVARPLSKTEAWKIEPDDVFKKEYVSYSRIKTFKTCQRKFELIYLYRLEDISGREAKLGSLIHKIIHLYTAHHNGLLSGPLENNSAVEELLNFYDQALLSTELTAHVPKHEIIPYLNNFVALNRKDNLQVKASEYEIDSSIGEYRLKCIIDRIDSENIIIDYKTGKSQNSANQQLNVYAYALNKGIWTPSRVIFQFLKTGSVREWEYTPCLHRATEEWLLEGIHKIENTKVFKRNTCRLCDYCGVSEHCYRVP